VEKLSQQQSSVRGRDHEGKTTKKELLLRKGIETTGDLEGKGATLEETGPQEAS